MMYSYKRGVGWVPGPAYHIESHKVGNYIVTFEERQPLPGEHSWDGDFRSNVDYVVTAGYYKIIFARPYEDIGRSIPTRSHRDADYLRPIVVSWKPL
jgi:hypothetical protein